MVSCPSRPFPAEIFDPGLKEVFDLDGDEPDQMVSVKQVCQVDSVTELGEEHRWDTNLFRSYICITF